MMSIPYRQLLVEVLPLSDLVDMVAGYSTAAHNQAMADIRFQLKERREEAWHHWLEESAMGDINAIYTEGSGSYSTRLELLDSVMIECRNRRCHATFRERVMDSCAFYLLPGNALMGRARRELLEAWSDMWDGRHIHSACGETIDSDTQIEFVIEERLRRAGLDLTLQTPSR